jgi:hypothetical protein
MRVFSPANRYTALYVNRQHTNLTVMVYVPIYLVEYLVLQTVIHQLMVNSQNLPPTRGTFLPPTRAKNVHARIGYTEDSLTIHVNSTHPSKSHYLTKVLTNSSTLPFKNGAHAPPSRPWLPRQCRRSPLYAFKHCPLPI